jgi:hypothetical protein
MTTFIDVGKEEKCDLSGAFEILFLPVQRTDIFSSIYNECVTIVQ